jgi:hypothetical protein
MLVNDRERGGERKMYVSAREREREREREKRERERVCEEKKKKKKKRKKNEKKIRTPPPDQAIGQSGSSQKASHTMTFLSHGRC